jgi:hypothetical protein
MVFATHGQQFDLDHLLLCDVELQRKTPDGEVYRTLFLS